ncbi:phytanoyl-CoA dioxygenase family protein [Massilia sp. PAMC28688]|uniref:phytanoyl-CoA dioxygenase family protein n=1 Tax=Massilia sp. PAMC28688 TaxID=2861283 RepID=UPI001C632917|nr:phytanoyl-CoA dioxygenase family protein [Massilia sp. PAMC28688]QYF92004.1 phytanoyl-CoA dioxygenase family protein [Massilia sp. PAMC28688]
MFTPQEIEVLKLQFDTHGFVHLRQIIPDAQLRRLHTAFGQAAVRARAPTAAQAKKVGMGYFDIPQVLDQDPAFVDLVDMDSIFPLLVALVGDDIQLTQTAARLFYPGVTFTAPFHSDLAHVTGFSHEHSLNFLTKVHYYLEDLAPDQGCLAFIPGSHRLPAGYPRPASLRDEHSAAVVKIVPQAGDAIIFNTHVMHMALDNKSATVRKSIIYAFSHFWMKQYKSAIPADLGRFTCRQRKQLFGVEEDDTPHFNRRLTDATPGPARQAVDSVKRVIRKLVRA